LSLRHWQLCSKTAIVYPLTFPTLFYDAAGVKHVLAKLIASCLKLTCILFTGTLFWTEISNLYSFSVELSQLTR